MSTPKPTYTLAQMRAYLEGKLSPEQVQRLEADLASDPLLAGAMERLESELDRQARSPEELAALEDTFRQAIPRQAPQQRSRPLWQPVALAAVLAVLLGTVYWTQFAASPPAADALFAEHFSPYEDLITQRGQAGDSLLALAMGAYNSGDFEKANSHFLKLVLYTEGHEDSYPPEPIVRLYFANSILSSNEHPFDAIEQLSILENETGSSMLPVVRWYSALAWLKLKEPDRAKEYLEALEAEGGGYGKRAEAVLEKL